VAFDLPIWKEKVRESLHGWKEWMNKIAAKSVYAVVTSCALWPLVEAFKRGDLAAFSTWTALFAGAGGSLIANKIQC